MLICYTTILSVLQTVQVDLCCAALVKTTPVSGPAPGCISVMMSVQHFATAVLTTRQTTHNVSYEVQCF